VDRSSGPGRGGPLRAATRGSVLARWQTDHVARLLGAPVETVVVETAGDRRRDLPISAIGGQGVFVKEVQAAVLSGQADYAVHSAKDLPSTPTDGLVLAAVPVRADPRDALVGSTLAGLPPGATVATGAVRRRAQLAALRPDLTFAELRGNVDTRLKKAGDYGAAVVAFFFPKAAQERELLARYHAEDAASAPEEPPASEQAPAPAHEHQKPPPTVMVLLVDLQVLGEVVDALGEERDLHLGRTRVGGMRPILGDRGRLVGHGG